MPPRAIRATKLCDTNNDILMCTAYNNIMAYDLHDFRDLKIIFLFITYYYRVKIENTKTHIL